MKLVQDSAREEAGKPQSHSVNESSQRCIRPVNGINQMIHIKEMIYIKALLRFLTRFELIHFKFQVLVQQFGPLYCSLARFDFQLLILSTCVTS